MNIWSTIGWVLISAVIGAAFWDRVMKREIVRRGYGRWNPENRKWQWYTQTGLTRARGFFK